MSRPSTVVVTRTNTRNTQVRAGKAPRASERLFRAATRRAKFHHAASLRSRLTSVLRILPARTAVDVAGGDARREPDDAVDTGLQGSLRPEPRTLDRTADRTADREVDRTLRCHRRTTACVQVEPGCLRIREVGVVGHRRKDQRGAVEASDKAAAVLALGRALDSYGYQGRVARSSYSRTTKSAVRNLGLPRSLLERGVTVDLVPTAAGDDRGDLRRPTPSLSLGRCCGIAGIPGSAGLVGGGSYSLCHSVAGEWGGRMCTLLGRSSARP